jgi:transposase
MENQVTREGKNNAKELFLAFELSRAKWKLGFSDGRPSTVRQVTIPSRNLERLGEEILKAKRRFGLEESVAVRSCYEAGRESFWLHRALEGMGIQNQVVDASSIEVNRRSRRAKTDRATATVVQARPRHRRISQRKRRTTLIEEIPRLVGAPDDRAGLRLPVL